MVKLSIGYNSNINIVIPQNVYLSVFNIIKSKLLPILGYVLIGEKFLIFLGIILTMIILKSYLLLAR